MHLGIYPRSYPRSTLVRMLTLALLDTRHPPVNFQLSCISCSSPMTQKSHFGYWDKYPTALASPCALTAGEKTPFSFGSGAGGVFSPHIFGSSKVESVLMASIKKLQISVTVHLFLISWYFLHPTSDSFFFFQHLILKQSKPFYQMPHCLCSAFWKHIHQVFKATNPKSHRSLMLSSFSISVTIRSLMSLNWWSKR